MSMRVIVFAALAVAALIAAATFVAHRLYWRPVMPEIVVELRAPQGSERPAQLLFVYGEAGSDPFSSGALGPDQRVSGCNVRGAHCIAPQARHEFRTDGPRRQSLRVIKLIPSRELNQVLGGVVWTGRSYPKRVRLVCDLGISEPRKACTIKEVVI